MREWLIVADDVTGALDSAVGFAGHGRVEYGLRAPADADVAAVSTGSRALPTPPTSAPAVDRSFARLYLKVDSTLRGWPADHVATSLAAWHRDSTAVVCPAAPALGRTVVGGRVLVDGVPATRTAAADDPIAPVREDRLPVLFEAPLVAPDEIASAIGRLPAVVVDASTAGELAAIAAAVDAAGPRAVPVGSAGLAAALGALRPGSAPASPGATDVVVLATTAHPVSQGQLAALGSGLPVIAPPPLDGARVRHADATAVARETAARAAQLLHPGGPDAVVVIGGDGTDALLAALGADGVEVLGAALPGVPWGRVRGGRADGLVIATKSGAFGGPTTLIDLIRFLTEETP